MVNFKTEKVSDRITRIFSAGTELMYLVEGEQKAALLDTGSGFGSLKKAVDQLTDKPVIVLLTHGHTDHAMGTAEFETVYMNRTDDNIFKLHGGKEFRMVGFRGALERGTVTGEEDFMPTDDVERFHDLKGGDVFDLGGVSIEIYEIPGHTRGSLAMLIREERTLLIGDACGENTFMFDEHAVPIREYKKNLERLKEQTEGKFDRALSSHMTGNVSAHIIEGVIGVCEDIIQGRTDDVPMNFRGHSGLLAKRQVSVGVRADGGVGNIIYNPNNI